MSFHNGLSMGTLRELEKVPSSPSKETCADTGQTELCCPTIRKSVPLNFQWTLLSLWDWGIMGSPPLFKCLLYPENHGNGQELFIWAEGLMVRICSFLSQEQTGVAIYQHCPLLTPQSKRGGIALGGYVPSAHFGGLTVDHLFSLSGLLPDLESSAELQEA